MIVLKAVNLPDFHAIRSATLLATGTLLAVISLLSGLFMHESVWRTSWVLGAIFMSKVVLHWPAIFDLSALSAAFLALGLVSVTYVAILAWLILPWNWNRAALAGSVWGLVCYGVNLYVLTTWFPWLTSERSWMGLAGHLLFGVVAALVLKAQTERDRGIGADGPDNQKGVR